MILLTSASLAYGQKCEPSAFAQLSKSEQARMFQTHFDEFYEKEQMNGAQRRLWVKFREVISAEAFSLMNDPNFLNTPFGKKFHANWKEAQKVFPQDKLKALFNPGEIKSESFAPTCGCSPTWTFCGFSSECATGSCAEVIDCGPFWQFLCSGMCRDVPSNDVGVKP